MASELIKLYSLMFPGGERLLPFSSLNIELDNELNEMASALTEMLNNLPSELEELEINYALSLLKKENKSFVDDVINKGLELYFTHPQVLKKIQHGKATLFPNARVLPDINFDLLIPVVEK